MLVLTLSPSSNVNATRTSIPIELGTPQPSLLNEINQLEEKEVAKEINKLALNPLDIKKPQLSENWQTITIKDGHSLSTVFSLAGFNDKTMYSVLGRKKQNKSLSRIFPGEKLAFLQDNEDELSKVKLIRSPLKSILYTKTEAGTFTSKTITRKPEIHTSYLEGEIDSSLFLAGQTAGLSQKQIMELANIFGWDIDFILDIRSGDKFSLIYEELYLDGEKYKNGSILAAKFSNQGRELEAFLYRAENGTSNYFTPEGSSMRKAFLRTPVDFARISSHFNLKRKHPILHRIRAHKGTDYAASRGTPIKATGDGKVIHRGRKGGYGNTVIIQHGQKFTTLYAHMSKYAKGIKDGTRVKQGQTIGYIGSTGLASGPHLHYEFRVNGVHKNSLKVKLPHASPIPKSQLADFKTQTHSYSAQLSTFSNSYQLAVNENQ
ncbi:MAG: murein DD-endopeptidase MepM/ murein hydrolase activator NlpD [Oleiphilaceae bacterium]|jgi:murein DD-endopeptidase MepM/ murein hydrolase activator NlpD